MLINGNTSRLISAADRGLQYGDGLFETLAVVDGQPRLWERHMVRLSRGEQRLGLPPQDKAQLWREALSLSQGHARAVLKILLTRGEGGRGYRPPAKPQISRLLSLHDWPDYPVDWYASGMRLRVCRTLIGRNRTLAGIKHLNRLEQVLARQEWDDPAVAEGLMLDELGHVIEGTQSNLFVLRHNRLMTPDLAYSGVSGVLRGLVLELAEELEIPWEIKTLTLADVKAAEAVFMTNSLLGICPVAELEGHHYASTRALDRLTERVRSLAHCAS